MAGINDLSFDDLIPQQGGVDPELLQAIAAAQKNPAMQQPPKPTKWNMQETRSPLQVLQDEQTQQQGPRPAGPNVSFDDLIPKPQNADANLGGTLTFGNPFGSQRFDTGIPIPASLEAGIIGAGKSATRLVQGVRQLLPGDNANLDKQVQGENAAYAPLAQAHPVATTIGESVPYLATGNPLAMGAMAATEYGSPQDRATRAAFAYGGGKVVQGVARMFGPASMAPTANTLASEFFPDAANKWGIPTTMGMTGGKPAQIAESVLSNLPFGGAVNRARDAAYSGFNRAVSNTFGEDSSKITPELLGFAKQRAGTTIGDIAGRNTLVANQQLGNDILAVQSRVAIDLAGNDAAQKLVNKQIELIRREIDPNTMTMPGAVYKSFDSRLGQLAKDNQGTVSSVLGDLRSAMRDAMDRSISPQDAKAWAVARHDYFNVNQVANANKNGALSPSQLLTQVNSAQRNARFGAGNDLAELAQWAKPTLTDQIPNSGTAQRLLYQKLLTNPLSAGAGLLGVGYGADKADISPVWGSAALLPMLAARGLAGKPVSDLTRSLLTRGGGLLGLGLSPGR